MEVDYLKSLGVGSGLDTKNIVTAIVEAEKVHSQSRIDQKRETIEAEISGLGLLKSAMLDLNTAYMALDDQREFNFATLANSEPSALSVEFDRNIATPGQHRIQISALASGDILASDSQDSQTADLNSGSAATFAFAVGSGEVETVTLDAGEASLDNLAEGINDLDTGVSARIVSTGSGYRLLLEGNSGSDNAITIDTDLFGIDSESNQLQTAQDASFTVNGLAVTRESNEVDDVIPGLKLNLATQADSDVVISITRNIEEAKQAIKDIVRAFNTFDQIVDGLVSTDAVTGDRGALANDTSVSTIKNNLRNLLFNTGSAEGDNISRMSDIGVSIDRHGIFQIDENRLQSALTGNFDEISTFFSGASDDQSSFSTDARGLAGDIVYKLDEYLASDGVIALRETSNKSNLKTLQNDQARLDTKVQILEERYTRQFAEMNKILDEMKSLREYLDSQLENLPFTSKND